MAIAGTKTVYLGRVFLALAFFALLGAWLTQLTGGPLFGLTQQHLFYDASALALLGIGWLMDALWQARKI